MRCLKGIFRNILDPINQRISYSHTSLVLANAPGMLVALDITYRGDCCTCERIT
jgi:hypothetical protein